MIRDAARRKFRRQHRPLPGSYEKAGVPWIEVAEDFVDTILETALNSGVLPDSAAILPDLQVLRKR